MPLKIPGRAYFGKMIVTLSIEHSFFMLALLVEYIFLATFYGLYLKHQFFTHYIIIQFFKFLQFHVDLCGQRNDELDRSAMGPGSA